MKLQPGLIVIARDLNLEIIQGSYTTHAFPRHFHSSYVVEVVQEGLNHFHYRGKVHSAPAGSIVLLNPGEVHTGFSENGKRLTYFSLYPSSFLLERVLETMQLRSTFPSFDRAVVHDPSLSAKLTQLVSLRSGSVKDPLLVQQVFIQAFSSLLMKYSSAAPAYAGQGDVDQVQHAVEYCHAHFTRGISLRDLSEASGMSAFHLIRSFVKVKGIAPYQYVKNLRVEHAKTLLLDGNPISDVAYECGFYDQSHLNRLFKKLLGVTPGSYRAISSKTPAVVPG